MTRNAGIPVTDGLLFALVPAFGSILDYSGNGRHPTVAGSGLEWARINGVDQLRAKSTGRLEVLNDATLQAVTDNSLFVSGNFSNNAALRPIFSKRDAGGTQYSLRAIGTEVRIWDGSSDRIVDLGDWSRVNSLTATLVSGGIGNASVNGSPFGAFSGTSTISADSTDIYLLNLYTGGFPVSDTITALLWYSRSIEAWESSLLHAWSESLISPRLPFDRRYFDMGSTVPNGNVGGVVLALDLSDVHDRSVTDKSGGGSHGSLVGGCSPVFSEAGKALGFDGVTGYIDIGATGETAKSVELVIKIAGNTKILDLDGGTHTLEVAAGSLVATGFASPTYYVDGAVGAVVSDGWHHIAVVTDTGISVSNLDIGRVAAAYGGHTIKSVMLNSGVLTLAEIKNSYLALAQKIMFDSALDQVRVTLADVTSGPLGNSGMDVITGTWAISEDATGKHYECVSAGKIRAPLPKADDFHTDAFVETGTATLTKNSTNIEIDAGAGDIIRTVRLTLGAP